MKKKLPKPRNPFVQHLIAKRGAGVHGKSKKAMRRKERMEVKNLEKSDT